MTGENNTKFYSNPRLLNALFFVFLVLILLNRLFIFFTVNIDYIDSDQPFMWAGAKDYSQGIFMEPRFYGQNYNTFMEGLFSVPFMWLGLPVYYALPLATHLIFLFPFLFAACWLFAKNKKTNALLVLAVLMCLPAAYDIMSSLPRGFVTSVFFAGFFVISFADPFRKGALALNLFMITLGYFVSPNSLIVSLPFLFYMFLHHYRNPRFYLLGGLCLALCVPLHFVFDAFYKRHPSYVIYGFEHDFEWKHFWQNLINPNEAFAHVSFFVEANCLPLLVAMSLLGYVLFKKNRKLLYAFLSFLALVLLTFSSGKSRDGTLWPWYSYSRMYIGLPLLLCLLLSAIAINPNKIVAAALLLALGFSGYKLINFKKALACHTEEKLWNGVHLVSLKSALDGINFYRDVCRREQSGFFLISNGFWLNTFLDYGGPAVYDDFPETEETNSERRYWVREKNEKRVIRQFVFLSKSYKFDKLVPANAGFELQRIDDFGLLLVKNNTLPMGEFIERSKNTKRSTEPLSSRKPF